VLIASLDLKDRSQLTQDMQKTVKCACMCGYKTDDYYNEKKFNQTTHKANLPWHETQSLVQIRTVYLMTHWNCCNWINASTV